MGAAEIEGHTPEPNPAIMNAIEGSPGFVCAAGGCALTGEVFVSYLSQAADYVTASHAEPPTLAAMADLLSCVPDSCAGREFVLGE
jgi:hypothetical protein